MLMIYLIVSGCLFGWFLRDHPELEEDNKEKDLLFFGLVFILWPFTIPAILVSMLFHKE